VKDQKSEEGSTDCLIGEIHEVIIPCAKHVIEYHDPVEGIELYNIDDKVNCSDDVVCHMRNFSINILSKLKAVWRWNPNGNVVGWSSILIV
jgi:hypothetical protein